MSNECEWSIAERGVVDSEDKRGRRERAGEYTLCFAGRERVRERERGDGESEGERERGWRE